MLKTTKFVMGCLTMAMIGTAISLPTTAHAEGEVTIQVPFDDFILDGESCELTVTTAEGDSISVKKWLTTNENVAQIDIKKGILRACTAGQVGITAETENGTAECVINVKSNEITEYKGVDYADVYDFNYYVKNPDAPEEIKKLKDPKAAIKHFVEKGMHQAIPGCANFNPIEYAQMHPDVRHEIHKKRKHVKDYEDLKKNGKGYDWSPFYMHYINTGKKAGLSGRSAEEKQEMVGYETVYEGVNYADKYNYNTYVAEHPDLQALFGADDYVMVEHYAEYGGGKPDTEKEDGKPDAEKEQ